LRRSGPFGLSRGQRGSREEEESDARAEKGEAAVESGIERGKREGTGRRRREGRKREVIAKDR